MLQCSKTIAMATPNKFPVSCPLPASPSWKSVPINSFKDVTDSVNSSLCPLCDHVFRENGGHVVERDDIRPLLLQNAAAVDWTTFELSLVPRLLLGTRLL